MTYEEYIAKLEELKKQAERAVVQKVSSLERAAYDLMVQYVDQNFDVKGGHFVIDERVLLALNSFTDQYLGAFTTTQAYTGAVSEYLKNFKDMTTLVREFQADQGVDLAKAKVGPIQEIVMNEIINRYSSNGLNSGFVQPLRQLLFNNTMGGLNKTQAMAQLQEYIAGGKDTSGKLHLYLEQTAQQGVDSYTGAVNVKIMQTFPKIDTMIMSGSLIKTSSPQCRYAIQELGGIIDRKDWPKLEELAQENGLIEGTTFETLPFNKLHWGCRHEFTPGVLTDAQRRAISSPVNN